MEVIEHDRYRTTVPDQTVHQLVHGRLDRRSPNAKARQRPVPEAVTEPLDGRRQVRPQTHRIIVSRIERHPNNRLWTLGTPGAQQRRLAVADGRVEHRQWGRGVAIEQLKQACPAQHPGVNPRQQQLRLDYPEMPGS